MALVEENQLGVEPFVAMENGPQKGTALFPRSPEGSLKKNKSA